MISPDDVKRLLDSDEPDALLVVLEGRADVVAKSALDSDEYRGALQVIDRDELAGRVGSEPSEHDLAEQAGILDASVSDLGG